MNTIQINAADGIAMNIRAYQKKGFSYKAAFNRVLTENPELAMRYRLGRSDVKAYDDPTLRAAQRGMVLLQADAVRARKLAGDLLDHLARERIRNVGHGVPDPIAGYRQALIELQREFPSLARAAQDGFVADGDWDLVSMLLPALQGEIEHGRYSRQDSSCCAHCGEKLYLCRARKLARERGVTENDVKNFAACIRDAQQRGNELDQLMCYFE